MIKISDSFSGSVSAADELREVYDFVRSVLGDDIITFEQYADMHRANPNVSHNIRRLSDNQMCGFLSFSFLSASDLEKLEAQTLRTMDLTGENQVGPDEIPACVYLGAIGAIEDKDARRATMQYYGQTMADYAQRFECSFLIRPVTEHGMKIAVNEGYQPMHEAGLEQLYILR